MDNKQKQIKYMQQRYYIRKYKTKKAICDITTKIKNGYIYVKIIDNVIHRHTKYLNKYNVEMSETPMQLIGCSKEQFENYIENKLSENMTSDNYGEWEIDHIYPISKINFLDIEEIKKYYHYTNLQPLWKLDNFKKSNKILA